MRAATTITFLIAALIAGDALAQPAAKTPSSILEQGLKLYESSDYHGASHELQRAAEGEGQDSDANRKRADFFLLKSLYHLGFHSAALGYARRIQQQGSASPYHEAVMKWVLALSAKIPDALGAPRVASQLERSTFASPALAKERWELTLLAARGHAQLGNESDAIDLLRGVPVTAAVRPRARMLLGILLARRNQLGRARGALGEAVALLEKSPASPTARAQCELALLQLARADWAAGARATALKHYARLAASSPFGPEAGLLRGASADAAGDTKRATEELHRLHGLRFSHSFFPEGLILRAAIYLREGELERSDQALKAFSESFGKLADQLAGFARREKDPGEVLGNLRRDLKTGGKLERQAATVAFEDLRVEEGARTVDGLDRELARVQSAPPSWKSRAIAGIVLQDLTLQKSLFANEVGTLILRRMLSLGRRIRALSTEAEHLRSAILRCRAMKQRAEVKVGLEPILPVLFQPREGVERHDLFTLKLELGGCAAR